MTLLDTLKQAESKKIALGHFNFATIDMLHAIVKAAEAVKVPVIVGVSEGERDFFGVDEAVSILNTLKKKATVPVFLNADHTFSYERVKEAIDAGFDSVIIDAAKLPFEENIVLTKQCVDYARSTRPDVVIEAELGYIGQSSALLDELPEGAVVDASTMSTPEQAKEYVTRTGIDLFAPAVGNIHGTLKNAKDPRLNIDHVRVMRQAAGIPLVLHGGSGHTDEDLVASIGAGISQIHISTDLRLAYKNAFLESIKSQDISPYKYLSPAAQAVQAVVERRLRLFSKIA